MRGFLSCIDTDVSRKSVMDNFQQVANTWLNTPSIQQHPAVVRQFIWLRPPSGEPPCTSPAVPPSSPILPNSSNIHRLSLSRKDHYCQPCDWTHSDGCTPLFFQRFLLYRCIIQHHHSLPKRPRETPSCLSFLSLIGESRKDELLCGQTLLLNLIVHTMRKKPQLNLPVVSIDWYVGLD